MATITSLRTVRVQNIPPGTLAAAEAWLRLRIGEKLTAYETTCLNYAVSIVPLCDDYSPQPRLGALLDFENALPLFLKDIEIDPLSTFFLNIDDAKFELMSFDVHFRGFTQLFPTQGPSMELVDVVAIGEVDDQPYEAWCGPQATRAMWLRHFMYEEFSGCRTMLYGYSTDQEAPGLSSIDAYALEFLSELHRVRKNFQNWTRPVIFIAHSLGGIVLARALTESLRRHRASGLSYTSCVEDTACGFIFFGVPSLAIDVMDMKQALSDELPLLGDYIEDIDENNEDLAKQLLGFEDVICGKQVISFSEEVQDRRLVMKHSRVWERSGAPYNSVELASLILPLSSASETKIPLKRSLSSLIQWNSPEDSGYQKLTRYLNEFYMDASRIVNARLFRDRDHELTTVRPCSTVPFKRNAEFVGRKAILQRLKNRFANTYNQERLALCGMGGVGKSEIAVEYAYRARLLHPDMWVFWISAMDKMQVQASFKQIAEKLRLPGCEDRRTNHASLVSNWLQDETNGRWLIIFDNVDDPRVLIGADGGVDCPSRHSFLSRIPMKTTGQVLFTARTREAGRQLTGYIISVISVGPMTLAESFDVLKSQLAVSEAEKRATLRLLSTLKYIPLAISLAAAYLRNPGTVLSIRGYVHEFRRAAKDRRSIHNLSSQLFKDDAAIPDSVIIAWQLSFEHVRVNYEDSLNLLRTSCLFLRKDIPAWLVWCINPIGFPGVASVLLDFGLMTVSGTTFNNHQLSMPRSVQLATRQWIKMNGRNTWWLDMTLRRLEYGLRFHEEWDAVKRRQVLPHAIEALRHESPCMDYNIKRALAMCDTGGLVSAFGDWTAGNSMTLYAMNICRTQLGPTHKHTRYCTYQAYQAMVLQRRPREANILRIELFAAYMAEGNAVNTATGQGQTSNVATAQGANAGTVENEANVATGQDHVSNARNVENQINTGILQNETNAETPENETDAGTLENEANVATVQDDEANAGIVDHPANMAMIEDEANVATVEGDEARSDRATVDATPEASS